MNFIDADTNIHGTLRIQGACVL